MNACRMEKGYRHWGHDIGPEDDPLEAGLGFTVAWDKPGGFSAATRCCAPATPARPRAGWSSSASWTTAKLLYHDEPIWAGGRIVGSVTSGMYGHRVGAPLGMGYLQHARTASPRPGSTAWRLEVEVAWERVPAKAQLAAWYDPRNERIRG